MTLIHKYTECGVSVEFDVHALCCVIQLPVDARNPDDIKILFNDPTQIRFLGTGFYFGSDQMVVTAKHIFDDEEQDFGPYFIFNFASAGKGKRPLSDCLTPVKHDARMFGSSDFVVIPLPSGYSPPMIPFFPADHDLLQDSGFFAVGFSPSLSKMTSERSNFQFLVHRCTSIAVEKRERSNTPDEFSLTFSAPYAEKGHSGGPVLNKNGRVVGVFSQMVAPPSASNAVQVGYTMGRASSLRPVIELIKTDKLLNFDNNSALRSWSIGDNPSSTWTLPP